MAQRPNIQRNDYHFIVNSQQSTLTVYLANGNRVESVPAHTEGVGGSYDNPSGDTPPGLYKVDRVEEIPANDSYANAYGPQYVWLIEMEGQESSRGRAGIGMHGGGSSLADPYYAGRQGWAATQGCIRLQNDDLLHICSLIRRCQGLGGDVWLTVNP
jgi:lipoprotein-anchoring transpeptidase ErfK/SrfK